MVTCIDGVMLDHFFKMKSSKIKAPIALIPDETALEIINSFAIGALRFNVQPL